MINFDKSVPFDPGYSQISFSFISNIQQYLIDYKKQKANHQKKFWLMKFEAPIIDLIEKSAAFYLGCQLWGGFIHERFKNNPLPIEGNSTEKLNPKELEELDCAIEAKAILEYIEMLNKDCKFLLKRPAKISDFITEILENYIEFAKINNNFIGVKITNDVKLPQNLSHFKTLSEIELDNLCEKIYETIKSCKIETLLNLGFYTKN